jgi:hypothetical protein
VLDGAAILRCVDDRWIAGVYVLALKGGRIMKVSNMLAVVVMVASGMAAMIANAQLQKATPEELSRRGMGPPANSNANAAPASTDPRNFAGSWRQARGGGPGGAPGGAGGAPGAARAGGASNGGAPSGPPGGSAPAVFGGAGAGGGPEGIDPNLNPPGNRGSASGRLPDRILCLPQSDPQYTGVDGPTLITQTPEQIVWAAEEMHHIRRIFLVGAHTPNYKPNYLGEAVGRWEADTLVVETQGLRNQAAGSKLVERWSKSADGNTLTIASSTIDASGVSTGRARSLSLGWSSGAMVYEWMCEDYNEEWLPGGTDFDDQLAR